MERKVYRRWAWLVSGIYDLRLLNEVLAEQGLAPVE